MRKLIILLKIIIQFPLKLFSKVSPITIIRESNISKKSAMLSSTRFYRSSLGDYSYVGRNCLIDKTDIGKYCSISDGCNIGLASHPINWVSTSPVFQNGKNILKTNLSDKAYHDSLKTLIENDVWIGISVCIKAGVKIGTGSIIGAGAIVTKDVEPYAIIAGNPGKLIRYRFDEKYRDKLLKSEWWNYEVENLKIAAEYIDDIDAFISALNGINV